MNGKWFGIIVLLGLFQWVRADSLEPGKLLIYYGYPSLINQANGDVQAAADTLGQYDFVVLGDGLEKASHSDHQNTLQIIQLLHQNYSTKVFGYIDLGVSTKNLTLDSIGTCIREWRDMGADGIFLDDFGYDYEVTRARQNAAVDSVHQHNIPVCANGWDPDDVFGDQVDATYNPAGNPTHLNSGDYYLSESYQISGGNYVSESDWVDKADKLRSYQQNIGFAIFSITTTTSSAGYDANKFHYAWYSALLYGHAATGWGEPYFSASSSEAPFRQRPSIHSGTYFGETIYHESPLHYRYTDLGKIWVNTSDHTYGFEEGDTPLPVTLQFFRAIQQGDSVLLKWRTESEVDNAGFLLQRQIPGFPEMWFVRTQFPELRGKGNCSHPTQYQFVDRVLPGSDSAYTITYRLWSEDFNGRRLLLSQQMIRFVPRPAEATLATHVRLLPAYPNPFNGRVVIQWQSDQPISHGMEQCEIAIYTLTGQRVRLLWRGWQLPSSGRVVWDATNNGGLPVASGVYWVVLRKGTYRLAQKIVLCR